MPKWGASNAGVTRFTLTKATNSGGIVYTKAQFQMERKLDEQEMELVKNLTVHIQQLNHNASPAVSAEITSPSDIVTNATATGLVPQFDVSSARST